jgi:methyltransferase family protein
MVVRRATATSYATRRLFSSKMQMSFAEQSALEGVLVMLQPAFSVEIGTAQGGSLERIAAHSGEVHTFDRAVKLDQSRFPNVSFHIGDSHSLLPGFLAEQADAGRQVDFALIDGDHERAGVASDVRAILDSPAAIRTVVLLHDTANEGVRAGIRDAGLDRPYVAYADLSFVPRSQPSRPLGEEWGGLGMIVVDRNRDFWLTPRHIDANVGWPTSVKKPISWHALRPVRRATRAAAYRARPVYRKVLREEPGER